MKKKHILLTAFAVSILLHILVFIFAPELKSGINSNDYLKRITKISIFQEPESAKTEIKAGTTQKTAPKKVSKKKETKKNETVETAEAEPETDPLETDGNLAAAEVEPEKAAPASGADNPEKIPENGTPNGSGDTDKKSDGQGKGSRRTDQPYTSGELAIIPKALNPKTPPYPETLEDEGIEGSVTLELLISKEGKVLKAKVIKSDHELFSESALQAAKNYKFSPGKLKDGSQVDSLIEFVIKFEISL